MNAPHYRPSAADRERALVEEAELLRRVAHNVPVAIAYYERAGFRCRYANQGYARMFGLDEQRILGRTFAEVIGAEAAAQIQPSVDTVLAERRTVAYERELPPDDGGPRFIEVSLVPHLGADGEAIGAFVLIADITRHRRAERALRESEDRLARFMHATQEGIVFHRDGHITDANPPLLALVGYTLEELRGRWAIDLVAPDERMRVADVMARGAELRYESAVQHRDGRRIPVEFIVRTMQFGGERLRMTIVRDMREWLDAQARIRHLAEHDQLTGLPNRSAFIERLRQRLAAAPATGAPAPRALLFVDLDHFKRVNDSLGHLAGDALLRTVAERLRGALGAHDLAGRFGGDEFLVLLAAERGTDGSDQRAAVERRARRLLDVVQAPVALPGASISVTPSIGIALFPDDGADADTLIQHADTAMYRAKGSGRAACAFFEPSMAAEVFSELQLESRLAEALSAGEFELLYQPQLRGAEGAVVAVEALLRWRHPQRGLLAPAEFLAVAEARRLLLPIGRWVLREALRQAARWPAGADGAPLRVAVNLSALEFQAADLLPMVTAALADAGVDGRTLEIELTEPLPTGDPAAVQAARTALEALRALGVCLTLDDFGTGTSALGRLRGLPIDRLKVDRSFVCGLPDDAGAAAIVRAIVQLAGAFGLRLVAEGIENEAQRAWVLAHGCSVLQGHALQAPLDAAALRRWLAGRTVAAD